MDQLHGMAEWFRATDLKALYTMESATRARESWRADRVSLSMGIQNSTMIYQPVLQWGPSAAGGGQKWSVASWYADGQDGHSFYSTLVDVAVGQDLTGVMTLTASAGKLMDYSSEFVGLANTLLKISKVEELTWANETLEAYVADTRSRGTIFRTPRSRI